MDQVKIVADTDYCLKVSGIISRSGVYDYPEGPTFKPSSELKKATRTARYAKLVIGADHPITEVVCQPDQLFGGVEKPFWDRTKLRATLNFDKSVTPKAFLNRVRSAARGGKPLNNSIGFYYRADWTPGEALDVNTGKKRKYVRVMRDILIDHVLVGDFKGRCSSPQCGIGIGIDKKDIYVGTCKVVKRGNQWCIEHTHGSKAGTLVKGSCHANKSETEAMHRAIEARKHGATVGFYADIHKLVDVEKLTEAGYKLFFGADAERPPKEFMDACMPKAEGVSAIKEAGAFCNWLYNNGPEAVKRSFSSSVSVYGGKKGMDQEKSEEAYKACITKETEGGASPEEAAETCKELKPTPETPTETDQEVVKGTPYQECIIKYTSDPHNLTMDEAIKKCKGEKVATTDQEQTEEEAREACIQGKMKIEGMTREKAAEACAPEVTETLLGALDRARAQDQESHEEPIKQLEELPTPLEQCISGKMDSTPGMSEQEAEAWCKEDLAGLHQPAKELVTDIQSLIEKEEKLKRRR